MIKKILITIILIRIKFYRLTKKGFSVNYLRLLINPILHREICFILCENLDFIEKLWIVENLDTPQYLLHFFSKDKDCRIRKAVSLNANVWINTLFNIFVNETESEEIKDLIIERANSLNKENTPESTFLLVSGLEFNHFLQHDFLFYIITTKNSSYLEGLYRICKSNINVDNFKRRIALIMECIAKNKNIPMVVAEDMFISKIAINILIKNKVLLSSPIYKISKMLNF